AWNLLRAKYENNSSQPHRTLMRQLHNSRMEQREDPDCFLVRIDQLTDDLALLDEPVTEQMDIFLSGLTSDYNLVEFQAMKDSELSLEDLIIIMRNMHVNGLTRPGFIRHRGSAMYTETSTQMDKSRVKCHACGRLGHYISECRVTNTDRNPSSGRV
ncbi:unnamed protein product, partial [Ectocarpus sp. 8 AP-2014]